MPTSGAGGRGVCPEYPGCPSLAAGRVRQPSTRAPRAAGRIRFADGGRIPVRCSTPHVCGSGRDHVRMEASPSPVYGAALLMRFGFTPIRGSNPRASAKLTGSFRASVLGSVTAGFGVLCPGCMAEISSCGLELGYRHGLKAEERLAVALRFRGRCGGAARGSGGGRGGLRRVGTSGRP
jgi:hypothetical protein